MHMLSLIDVHAHRLDPPMVLPDDSARHTSADAPMSSPPAAPAVIWPPRRWAAALAPPAPHPSIGSLDLEVAVMAMEHLFFFFTFMNWVKILLYFFLVNRDVLLLQFGVNWTNFCLCQNFVSDEVQGINICSASLHDFVLCWIQTFCSIWTNFDSSLNNYY